MISFSYTIDEILKEKLYIYPFWVDDDYEDYPEDTEDLENEEVEDDEN